jgi:very-short-patch-repair endonuclease
MKKINWEEVQEYYNNNHTWRDIINNFKISNTTLESAIKNNKIKFRSRSDANRLANIKHPQKHTEETKKKISEIRKKYLIEHPEKVPYLSNHYSKGNSYPEKYFHDILSKSKLNYERYFQIYLYELDFAFLDKKIDLEIDGGQHIDDRRIFESDIRRNEYLKNEGWEVIRINWKKYQKLNKEEKKDYVSSLVNYINNRENLPYLINKITICPECGGIKKWKTSKVCRKCYSFRQRKIKNRPSLEELLKGIEEIGYEGVGRKYGVTGNNIKKWLKNYNFNLTKRTYKKGS